MYFVLISVLTAILISYSPISFADSATTFPRTVISPESSRKLLGISSFGTDNGIGFRIDNDNHFIPGDKIIIKAMDVAGRFNQDIATIAIENNSADMNYVYIEICRPKKAFIFYPFYFGIAYYDNNILRSASTTSTQLTQCRDTLKGKKTSIFKNRGYITKLERWRAFASEGKQKSYAPRRRTVTLSSDTGTVRYEFLTHFRLWQNHKQTEVNIGSRVGFYNERTDMHSLNVQVR